MGFILYPLAISLILTLYGVLFPLSALLDWKGLNARLRKSALVIDVLGAVLFAPVWNRLLIKSIASQKFGELWQSISEILGYAQQEGTLLPAGSYWPTCCTD